MDIQENVRIGQPVCCIFEGVFNRENFKVTPFGKFIEKLFALGQKFKSERKELMQVLVKIIMNTLYRFQISENNNNFYKC